MEIDPSIGRPYPGTGLIKLAIPKGGDAGIGDTSRIEDEDSVFTLSGTATSGCSKQENHTAEAGTKEVWVDR